MVFKKFHKLKLKSQIIVVLLVGFAVVAFWRGVWGLLDIYLFPQDYHLSLWVSLLLGLLILAATHYTVKELT